MGAVKYTVKIDVASIMAAVSVTARDKILPAVHAAVGAVAQSVENRWKSAVLHAGGKGGLSEFERDAYAQSISWFYLDDWAAVVRATYKGAREIEDGRPARDLKAMLSTSNKVRQSAKGKRYLIIPFRHNTPGNTALAAAMPGDVYALAKALSPSRVTGAAVRPSGLKAGLLVPAHVYKWGDRLPAGLTPKLKTAHASDPTAGMVRMDTSIGGKKSSAYLTFRVMHQDSGGWVIPARPGLMLAKKVSDEAGAGVGGIVERVVAEAKS